MFKKKNYKIIVGILVGIFISSGMVVANSYKGAASEIKYDNGTSGLSSSNVQDALDELYDIKSCPDNTGCVPYKNELEEGDYVSYTPSVTSYPTDTKYTGHSSSQTIYPSELNLWRVLNINSDGTIDLISEYVSSTAVYFKNQKGYFNLVGYLNVLASQYETEGITSGSRYFGYNGQTEYITGISLQTSTPPYGCSTNGTKGACSNSTYPNDPDDYESSGGGDVLYSTDLNKVIAVLGTAEAKKVGTTTSTGYWAASRYYNYTSSTNFSWYDRYVNTAGDLTTTVMYGYGGSFYSGGLYPQALRPIVTLESGLEYEGIGIEEVPMKIIT